MEATKTTAMSIGAAPSEQGMPCFPHVIPFAVALPSSVVRGWEEPEVVTPVAAMIGRDDGIVGTIMLMKKSALVWFGWGKVIPGDNSASGDDEKNAAQYSVGTEANLSMGPLMVAMPRTNYKGAFSSSDATPEAASSKLIGSDNEEEELIARQTASRLSQKLGVSIMVSCSFAGAPTLAVRESGADPSMVRHRAAALAEKEVYRLLKDRTL